MSTYRRSKLEGGVLFFTVTLANRSSDLLVRHIDLLREVYASIRERRAFDTIAICILPDHLHAIWRLPQGDANFPVRWSQIKSGFSRSLRTNMQRSNSKIIKREKGIWQRRYWEHTIRNDTDLARHVDYVHFNPVKHGYVSVCATGLTAPFLATSHAACCRRTGEVIWELRRARTVSDGRTLRLKKSGVGKIAQQ